MKTRTRLLILFVLLLILALPGTAYARGLAEDKVVFGGNYTLASGETLNGSLLVFGGNATLESGSTVTNDAVILGGNLEVDGHVMGNVVSIGGNANLSSSAQVDRDVNILGGQLTRDPAAKIGGTVNTNPNGPFSFNFSGWRGIYPGISLPDLGFRANPLLDMMWYLFKAVFWAILAVLVVLFVPHPTERVTQTVLRQPLLSGGLGLLTILVLPALLVILAITICLIPVSLIGGMLLVLAWAFGLIAIGTEVGKRLAVMAKQEWALAVEAALGTFILLLVLNGVGFIPCVGWILSAVVGMVGLGAVLLTRFGTQNYPTELPAQAGTGAPPLPPTDLPAQSQPPAAPEPPEPPQI